MSSHVFLLVGGFQKLKNMLVKMGSSSPIQGVNIKKKYMKPTHPVDKIAYALIAKILLQASHPFQDFQVPQFSHLFSTSLRAWLTTKPKRKTAKVRQIAVAFRTLPWSSRMDKSAKPNVHSKLVGGFNPFENY